MFIKTLKLFNFRNYTDQTFEFSDKTTVIIGPNGAGKTNILEAISTLSFGKSHKAIVERDLIRVGAPFARISGELDDTNLEIILQTRADSLRISKTLKVNNVIKTGTQFAGLLKTVYFSPDDIRLVSGSPSRRREYLDKILSQGHSDYYKAILKYQRIVKHRNKLLEVARKQGSFYNLNSQFEIWDKQLIETGSFIQNKRKEFFDYAKKHTFVLSRRLYSQKFTLGLEYYPSLISEEKLLRNKARELSSAITQSGPHRDDYAFNLFQNDIPFDLKNYGSRGQQRTGVLCVKLIEMKFIEEVSKLRPVLLMDDIFSELDENYRSAIESVIQDQQTIITSADINMIPDNIKSSSHKIQL